MTERTDKMFCPKCRSTNVDPLEADSPEWTSAYEIGTREYYECNACGHRFTIIGSYVMKCFCFPNDKYRGDEDIEMEY